LFHVVFFAFAEAPKNYLKGKFYESVENNFLIATEKMLDGRFKKTVIVMLSNDKDGAWGLVINKPIGLIPLKLLINNSEIIQNEKKELYSTPIPIFWGGPVEKQNIFILHTEDYKSETTKNYKGISITRDSKILLDIAKKKGPKKSLVILGYSGWGEGQLEGEMEMDHWALSELDFDIIFQEESKNRWPKAYKNSFIRL
jgi:putative transcriptional regulator